MQIQFIGCGKMGEAFLKNILNLGIEQTKIYIFETYPPRVEILQNKYPKVHFQINKNADIIILAIKPQQLDQIDFSIFPTNITILSMLAGSSINTIYKYSKIKNIIRCMPNLPLSIGQGAGGYYVHGSPKIGSLKIIENMFSKIGYFIKANDEDTLDKITSISGSGPAYFFYFTQLLQQQAEKLGLGPTDAKKLVEQTFIGSAKLLISSDLDAQQLKENVTSKGGTTEAALKSFKENGLSQLIEQATNSAYKRAQHLNK